MPDMVRLASMDGVYAFSLDAGAFGATIGQAGDQDFQAADEPAGPRPGATSMIFSRRSSSLPIH